MLRLEFRSGNIATLGVVGSTLVLKLLNLIFIPIVKDFLLL